VVEEDKPGLDSATNLRMEERDVKDKEKTPEFATLRDVMLIL